MDIQQNTQAYLRRIHELLASYNDKNENGVEMDEEETIDLLIQARTLVHEAISFDQSNDELMELHVELTIVLSRYFLAKVLAEESYTQSLIEPEEFARRWGSTEEELVPLDPELMKSWNIGADSIQFLAEAGLPDSAAPFLVFGQAGRLWEVWDFAEDAEYARELFASYIQIGLTETGNPLCLDEDQNGMVLMLDPEFGFQALTFVNSTVQQLAECLLVYRVALEEIQRSYSEEAGINKELLAGIADWVEQEVMRIDSRAMGRECFWNNEVALLRSNTGAGDEFDDDEPDDDKSDDDESGDDK